MGDGDVCAEEAVFRQEADGIGEFAGADLEADVLSIDAAGFKTRVVHGGGFRMGHGIAENGETDGRRDASGGVRPVLQVCKCVNVFLHADFIYSRSSDAGKPPVEMRAAQFWDSGSV